MREIKTLASLALIFLSLAGCGSTAAQRLTRSDRAVLALDLAHTRQTGAGPGFRPPAASLAVVTGARVGRWRCLSHGRVSYGAHLELFARGHGVLVPAGIGISSPQLTGYRVTGSRCAYPLRTVDPTGLIEVGVPDRPAPPTLSDLFRLWGQPLSADRLGAFTGAVRAYVDGRAWTGDPRLIPLRRHTQIVLELGGFVAPHTTYGFPAGL